MAMQLSNPNPAKDFFKELMGGPLHESHSTFEASPVWKYSELSRLCYEDEAPGYENLIYDEHEKIIGKKEGDEGWIGFRGSGSDPNHWLGATGNLNAVTGQDFVCKGFANAMEAFKEPIANWCRELRTIHLTGHSRGAALATLAGWHLARELVNVQVKVVVFGCPRVGMWKFVEKYRQQGNLQWAGFQHRQDHVGNVPGWCQHIHPLADPLTDFQTDSSSLLQRVPGVGKILNVMWVFGHNTLKAHSMESYHMSLKCNFILRSRAANLDDDLINVITDPMQKAMLAIGVQAVKTSASKIEEQLENTRKEIKELLGPEHLSKIFSEERMKEYVADLLGTTKFLTTMCSINDVEAMKSGVIELERNLNSFQHRFPEASSPTQASLLESFLKGGLVLAACRKKLGDKPEDLKKRFSHLVEDLHEPLLKVAKDLGDVDSFHKALPSLPQVEAALAAHLDSSRPLLLTDDIQEALLPLHLQPSEVAKQARAFQQKFRAHQMAAQRFGGVARLLSSTGIGGDFIQLLRSILGDGSSDSQDENVKKCHQEVEHLKLRMDDLQLPEVAITGPTNSGKSSLVNSLLGKEVASTMACPDSFFPIRFFRQQRGLRHELQLRGTGITETPDFFKSRLEPELQQFLEPQEVETAVEVHAIIQKMNEEFRKFFESQSFAEKFSPDEIDQLSGYVCRNWAVDVKVPLPTQQDFPLILADLPGVSEGGIVGEFIKTMVAGSCSRASTALLVLTSDMLTELERDQGDPVQRFFGGIPMFSGYFLVISKVFGKKQFDEVSPVTELKAKCLNPQPLGIRFINSYLLAAYREYSVGRLPEKFPTPSEHASEEEKRSCFEEQRRWRVVFQGVQNREMDEADELDSTYESLRSRLTKKLDEFPDTSLFAQELFMSVNHRFPELFLGPPLTRMQKHIQARLAEICMRLQICRSSVEKRKQDMVACRTLLDDWDGKVDECLKIAEKRADVELESRMEEIAGELCYGKNPNFDDMNRLFGPHVADVHRRNVPPADRQNPQQKWNGCVVGSVLQAWLRDATATRRSHIIQKLEEHIFPATGTELQDSEFSSAPNDIAAKACSKMGMLWDLQGLVRAPKALAGFAKGAFDTGFTSNAAVVAATTLFPGAAVGLATLFAAGWLVQSSVVAAFFGQDLPSKDEWLDMLATARKKTETSHRDVSGLAKVKLHNRLVMLEAESEDADLEQARLQDFEDKLQRHSQVLAHLQEISAWVKQPPTPVQEAGAGA